MDIENYKIYLLNHCKILISLFLIIVFLLLYFLFCPISNPSIEYKGISENFNINGQNLKVKLNANQFDIQSNIIKFNNVKNVEIEKEGQNIFIANRSNIIAEYNYEEDYPTLSNGYFQTTFNNLTITKNSNFIFLEGDVNNYVPPIKIIPSGDKFFITDHIVNSITINGEEYSDFILISFDVDETSTLELVSDIVKIRSNYVSKFEITNDYYENKLSEITLYKCKGLLRVDDRTYNIKNTDSLNLKLNSNYPSSISIIDNDIEFNGNAISGQVNGKNILKNILFYWFDQQTEKINALAALILAIITLVNVFLTMIYVSLTMGILKQTKASVIQGEANIKQTDKILKQTKAERIFNDNEKLLMCVYSPMEVIFAQFKLTFEYSFQSNKSHEIPIEYNLLFEKMTDDLLEIKKTYGYLFDMELTQFHDNVWKSWLQYLNSDEINKQRMYMTLNSRINVLHHSITIKIKNAQDKRNEINQNFNS